MSRRHCCCPILNSVASCQLIGYWFLGGPPDGKGSATDVWSGIQTVSFRLWISYCHQTEWDGIMDQWHAPSPIMITILPASFKFSFNELESLVLSSSYHLHGALNRRYSSWTLMRVDNGSTWTICFSGPYQGNLFGDSQNLYFSLTVGLTYLQVSFLHFAGHPGLGGPDLRVGASNE
jgi:hypothetical protein